MYKYLLTCIFVVLALNACSTPPKAPAHLVTNVWHDQEFHYTGEPSISKQTLFEISDQLKQQLSGYTQARANEQERIGKMITLLFGDEGRSFPYASGHSTIAMDTWRNHSGDCLSLTVLAYAMAKELGLDAHLQEVKIPMLVNRVRNLDLIVGHVNLAISHEQTIRIGNHLSPRGDLIIDFEPSFGPAQRGVVLTEDEILSRFYNNMATEFLESNDTTQAYRYYRAAITTSPQYAPSYANMAQMYMNAGFNNDAEILLRNTLSFDNDDYSALHSLRELLVSQGRNADVYHLDERIQAQRNQDPYYWLQKGVHSIEQGQYIPAIDALEHAEQLTNGFLEVHRYLAVAYALSGDQKNASAQLKKLESLGLDNQSIALLSKKIERLNR